MVFAAFAKKGPPSSKEEAHWRVLSVVGFTIVRSGLSLEGNALRPDAVVRVVADDNGVVPGRPGGGAVVRAAADDDGIVPRRPSKGTTVVDMVLDAVDDGTLRDPNVLQTE